MSLRIGILSLLAVTLAVCSGAPVAAARTTSYLAAYESGHRALRYSSWDEALFWFRRAVSENPRDGGPPARLSGRNYVAYLPHYYVGLALFQGGRYSEALEAWDAAETQWKSEPWLAGSKGLAEYRATLASYRAKYEKELLPGAIRDLNSDIENVRGTIARLKAKHAPQTEIAAAEALLPAWSTRAAAAGGSYREVLALTREVLQVLDRLEVFESCAGSEAVQPWCRPGPSSSEPGSARAGAAPAVLQRGEAAAYRLANTAAGSAGAPATPGLYVRDQDVPMIQGLYRKKCALLISPSYTRWEVIPEAKPKLLRLKGVLEKLGFEVIVLPQTLSKDQIEGAIFKFIDGNAPLVADKPNLLFVHFIGHGHTLKSGGDQVGVLVTSTTPESTADPAALASQAVFEGFFNQFLNRPLHHIVFTFETCSSGKFLDQLAGANPKDWRKSIGSPAFLVLTAGDVDEVGSLKQLPLTDELTRIFGGCGQDGKTVVWSGFLMLDGVKRRLMERFHNRNPQFRKHVFDQHREGDFVLVVPDRCAVL